MTLLVLLFTQEQNQFQDDYLWKKFHRMDRIRGSCEKNEFPFIHVHTHTYKKVVIMDDALSLVKFSFRQCVLRGTLGKTFTFYLLDLKLYLCRKNIKLEIFESLNLFQ